MSTDIVIPHNQWTPRPHQMKLWRYLHEGGTRALAIWHRRAGKDEVALHHAAVCAVRRVGNYWHCLPEFEQARRSIWTAVNPHTGRRRIDEAFPHEFRDNTNDSTMFIRFRNGSTWACIGSDRYDATMGASPAGIVYSEWALSNPSAWAYHRPMLQENGGWACFISTPRGRNHAFDMFKHAQRSPEWFAELLTAHDTAALSSYELNEALTEYRTLYGEDAGQAMFDQELMCSFNAAILGAMFAFEMAAVRKEDRVIECEAIEGQPVHRAWDIGVTDDTAIFWWQMQGGQVVILDCYSASGQGLEHFVEVIERKRAEHGWIDGTDWVPHDAKVKEWGSGKTRVETMSQLGLSPMLVTWSTMQDGINAARRTLPLCIFHPRCEPALAALEQYRREWDDELKAFRLTPLHDWTSHFADAFRYLAQAWRQAPRRDVVVPLQRGWIIPPPQDAPRKRGVII